MRERLIVILAIFDTTTIAYSLMKYFPRQVYLTDAHIKDLARISKKTGKSRSQIIREAFDQHIRTTADEENLILRKTESVAYESQES